MATLNTCIECEKAESNKPFYKLPCAQIICDECINSIKLEDVDKLYNYKCAHCKSTHNLNKKSNNTLLNDFKGKVDELLNSLNKFQEYKESNMEKIHLKCQYIRDELDVTYESVVEKLNERRLKLIEQINNYEIECEKRFNNEQFNNECNKLFEDTRNKLNEESNVSASPNFCSLYHIQSDIDKKINDYKAYLNANKEIEYEFNETIEINPQTIGYLNIKPKFKMNGFDYSEKIHSLLDGTKTTFEIEIENENEEFCLFPILENSILVRMKDAIKIFDSKGNLVSSKAINTDGLLTTQIYNFFTVKDSVLYKYDYEFNVVAQEKLDCTCGKLLSICASNSYVYVLRISRNFDYDLERVIESQCSVDVYKSSNLEFVERLNQIDITDEYEEFYSDGDCCESCNCNDGIELEPIEIYTNQNHNKLYVYSRMQKTVFALDEERGFRRINEVSFNHTKFNGLIMNHKNSNKFIDANETMFFKLKNKGALIKYGEVSYKTSKLNFDSIMVTHNGTLVTGKSENKKIIVEVY